MDAVERMHTAIRERDYELMRELTNGAPFARLLGMETVELRQGYAKVIMPTRQDMDNHFASTHGGVGSALADQTFAAACNTLGRPCVGMQLALVYLNPARSHDLLTAEAWVRHDGKRVSTIEIQVLNSRRERIVSATGIGYYVHQSSAAAKPRPRLHHDQDPGRRGEQAV